MTNIRNNNRQTAHRVWRKFKQLFSDSINSFEKRSFWYSALLHLLLVTTLVTIGVYMHKVYNKPTPVLVSTNRQNPTPIINAEIISNNNDKVGTVHQTIKQPPQKLTSQQQNELKAIEQKIAKAKQIALKKLQDMKVAEQKKQEKLNKHEHEKAEQLKQVTLQAEKEAQSVKEQALEKQRKEREINLQKEKALKALQQSVLSDLNRQNETALEQLKTQAALENYAAEYKKRIESAWIMDDCHNINTEKLPTVLVTPNQAPSIVISSGNLQCDHALLLAFHHTQTPSLPQDAAAQKIIQQGIDFQFGALAQHA